MLADICEFFTQASGVDLIKLFCKLDHFYQCKHDFSVLWKDIAFKKEWVNLHPKKFFETDPSGLYYKSFTIII
jgi:hypothetical protein